MRKIVGIASDSKYNRVNPRELYWNGNHDLGFISIQL